MEEMHAHKGVLIFMDQRLTTVETRTEVARARCSAARILVLVQGLTWQPFPYISNGETSEFPTGNTTMSVSQRASRK